MRFYATITRRDGKTVGLADSEYLDIDIKAGNRVIAQLTVRDGEHGPAVFNANDDDIVKASCAYNQAHHDGGYCAPCTGHAGAPSNNNKK